MTRRLSVQEPSRIRRLQRQLSVLDAANQPADMNIEGWRWHPLGKMAPGRYAVEVTGNWRLTYAWDGGAVDVDLEDYH